MAEDKRKKRKYPTTKTGALTPMSDIATVGKHPGRALQPSAEAKRPGEMYGPYRGPFNDPKYHQRGEPVDSIMKMNQFPQINRPRPVGGGGPRLDYHPGADVRSALGNQVGAVLPQASGLLNRAKDFVAGQTGKSAWEIYRDTVNKGAGALYKGLTQPITPEMAQMMKNTNPLFPYPWDKAVASGRAAQQTAAGIAATPRPATGPLGMNRNDTIQPTGTVGTRAGTASGTPPGQDFETAWAKYYKDNPPVGGKPDIFYGPGEARAMPGGGGPTPPPTHIIKGNAEGYKDWNTGQTFGTFDEAVRGEVSAETKARAAKAAEQAFELQKIVTEQAAKGGEIKWREGDQQIVDGEMVSTGGEYYDTKKGPLRGTQGGSVGLQNFQPALAAAGTNADIIDALINGTFPDAQSRIKAYEMLSKEQIEAMREKRKGKRQK